MERSESESKKSMSGTQGTGHRNFQLVLGSKERDLGARRRSANESWYIICAVARGREWRPAVVQWKQSGCFSERTFFVGAVARRANVELMDLECICVGARSRECGIG